MSHPTELDAPEAEKAFEALLPKRLQSASRRFFTPGAVAQLGARWLEAEGARTVLDVGSGAGKFCTLGALSTSLRFSGIEHRKDLVSVADQVATKLGAKTVSFAHGQFNEAAAKAHDALYFFNPFGENIFDESYQLDQSVELSERRFVREISLAERTLRGMPVGSLLLTYYCFGGRIPQGYTLVRVAHHGRNQLRLWRKTSNDRPHGYWLELDDRVQLKGATQPTR